MRRYLSFCVFVNAFDTASVIDHNSIQIRLTLKAGQKIIQLMRRYGSPSLLFAWLPIVGDAICVAAGWLRMNWLAAWLPYSETSFSAHEGRVLNVRSPAWTWW